VNPEARPESLLSRNGVADSVLTESRGRGGFGVSPQQVEGQQQVGQGQQASAQPADDANAAAPPEPQSSAAKPLRVLFRLRVADPHGPPEPTRP
jgi:hypothetical protein